MRASKVISSLWVASVAIVFFLLLGVFPEKAAASSFETATDGTDLAVVSLTVTTVTNGIAFSVISSVAEDPAVEGNLISDEILSASPGFNTLGPSTVTDIVLDFSAAENSVEVAVEGNLISQPILKKTLPPPQLMKFYQTAPSFVYRSFNFRPSYPLSLTDDQLSFRHLNCLTGRENPGLGPIQRRLCTGTHTFLTTGFVSRRGGAPAF